MSVTAGAGREASTVSCKQLVDEYVAAIRNKHAALFVGAGLSRESGYVDWKGLLRGCAEELGLDLEREYDLVAVAQYYLNLSPANRHRLNTVLYDEFSRKGEASENHRIIGRLPLATIWTTNFDTLIEDALSAAHRKVDVKTTDRAIALTPKNRDVVLYKMHGDIAHPDEVVICKADYEQYAQRHRVFQNALENDLVTKTFLFLGFSFADPNLNYMLGHLRSLLEDNQHQHFAVMRRVRQNWHLGDGAEDSFQYEHNKQRLLIGELERYNIRTHLVDRFSDVTGILRAIEEASLRRNVFVSGSAHEFDDRFDGERVANLCLQLGELLIARGRKLVSGFGLHVGQHVIQGAVLAQYASRLPFEECIALRPFPRELPPNVSSEEFLEGYRRRMISESGFAVFIAGTSRSHRVSRGVMEEYRIARELGKVPIPLGATGFAAEQIWRELRDEREAVYDGRVSAALYDRLGDRSLSEEQLVEAVFGVMNAVDAA